MPDLPNSFHLYPQAVKPKSGVFCFLITEARETTALEMPDRENTFVLRVSGSVKRCQTRRTHSF